MYLDMKNSGTVSVLTLPGNLSDHYAETLKMYLRRSLDCTGRLIVDCGKVTSVDPDCLKILCSAYRLSRTMRKGFVVAGQRPGLFLKAVKETENGQCMGCGPGGEEDCVWVTPFPDDPCDR